MSDLIEFKNSWKSKTDRKTGVSSLENLYCRVDYILFSDVRSFSLYGQSYLFLTVAYGVGKLFPGIG